MNRIEWIRFAIVKLVYLAIILVNLIAIVLIIGIIYGIYSETDRYREVVENPEAVFKKNTDMEIPSGSEVLLVDDSHGGIQNEGDFFIVLETNRKELENWLETSPPWEVKEWIQGPVPEDFISKFDLDHLSETNVKENEELIRELKEKKELFLTSQNVWYVALERCCEHLHWHNGHLMVLDMEHDYIWLVIWDM